MTAHAYLVAVTATESFRIDLLPVRGPQEFILVDRRSALVCGRCGAVTRHEPDVAARRCSNCLLVLAAAGTGPAERSRPC